MWYDKEIGFLKIWTVLEKCRCPQAVYTSLRMYFVAKQQETLRWAEGSSAVKQGTVGLFFRAEGSEEGCDWATSEHLVVYLLQV